MFEKLKRSKQIKETVKSLKNKNLILSSDGYLEDFEAKKFNNLSDEELIYIIKYIDNHYLFLESETKKEYFNNVANEIKKIMIDRIISNIKTALLLTKCNQIGSDEVLPIKLKLEYYLNNLSYNKKLLNLINDLNQIQITSCKKII